MNLIIVCGMPCTGKTTISKCLSSILGIDRLSKDYFKEVLFEKYGFRSEKEKKALDTNAENTLYREIEKRIEQGTNVVVDKWLQGLEQLKTIKNLEKANIIFVRLYCDVGIAVDRYNNRNSTNSRPLSFISKNQYPVVDKQSVVYEEKMTYETMLEKSCRPFSKNGINNLLEVDTSKLENNYIGIMGEILSFVKMRLK